MKKLTYNFSFYCLFVIASFSSGQAYAASLGAIIERNDSNDLVIFNSGFGQFIGLSLSSPSGPGTTGSAYLKKEPTEIATIFETPYSSMSEIKFVDNIAIDIPNVHNPFTQVLITSAITGEQSTWYLRYEFTDEGRFAGNTNLCGLSLISRVKIDNISKITILDLSDPDSVALIEDVTDESNCKFKKLSTTESIATYHIDTRQLHINRLSIVDNTSGITEIKQYNTIIQFDVSSSKFELVEFEPLDTE